MSYGHILVREEEGIAEVTFNRPQVLNAMNAQMVGELVAAMDELRDAGRARVVVISGAGRAFSSGADLAPGGRSDDCGGPLETHFNPLLLRVADFPCPLIAAVNGAAAGAGCSIAMACDFTIAARSAYFLQAFVNIGLVPDLGSTWLLPRVAGAARAREMMMLGERVSADQAAQWGMIHKVVEDAELALATRALATRLAFGPTRAYSMIRQGIRYALEHSLVETLHLERRNQLVAGRTKDFREGVDAFREKRPARFAGN